MDFKLHRYQLRRIGSAAGDVRLRFALPILIGRPALIIYCATYWQDRAWVWTQATNFSLSY
jgi:hypothetical protein